MKKLILVSLSAVAGAGVAVAIFRNPLVARAGAGHSASQNGDVNNDGADGVTRLRAEGGTAIACAEGKAP